MHHFAIVLRNAAEYCRHEEREVFCRVRGDAKNAGCLSMGHLIKPAALKPYLFLTGLYSSNE